MWFNGDITIIKDVLLDVTVKVEADLILLNVTFKVEADVTLLDLDVVVLLLHQLVQGEDVVVVMPLVTEDIE